MSNYKEIYLKLFNEITDVIEHLKEIQQETEEIYISQEEPKLIDINSEKIKHINL